MNNSIRNLMEALFKRREPRSCVSPMLDDSAERKFDSPVDFFLAFLDENH